MTDVELIAEWLNDMERNVHRALEKMPADYLAWQPDSEANSIGVTVWHMARWLDILGTMLIDSQDASQELWFTRGWAEKTKYDPRGIGSNGLGAVTGYSQTEVKAVPAMDAADLLAYYVQVSQALHERFLRLIPADLNRLVNGLGSGAPSSVYTWIKDIMQGCLAHVGEIFAIRAMYKRAHRLENHEKVI